MKRPICLLILTMLLCGCMSSNVDYRKAEEHYQKAKEYINKKDTDNAIFHLEKAIDLRIKDGNIYGMLGGLYKIKGEKSKARKYLTTALKMFEKELKIYRRENNRFMIRDTNEAIRRTKKQLETLDK